MIDWKVEALKLAQTGKSWRKIAKELNVPRSTVSDYLRVNYKAPTEVCEALSEVVDSKVVGVDMDYDMDLDVLTTNSDFSVSNLAKRLRASQKANTQLRKVQRELFDTTVDHNNFLAKLEQKVKCLSYSVIKSPVLTPTNGAKATLEILFSDMQIGKLCADYNTSVAKERVKKFRIGIERVLSKPEYSFERVILASIGDIVEDHLKHGVGSASSCDTGLAEQMANAIEVIWTELLAPIAHTGVHIDVMCVAGNHGSSQHKGMDVYKAGLFSYDYAIYKSLELLSKASNLKNVNFIIPEGVFGYLNIYGNYAIYEHGYFNAVTEKGMYDQMKKRGNQIKKHVEYYRQGDKHNVQMFDCGKIVLNGAFFGNDNNATEYAGVLGFSAVPAQVVMVHCPEERLGRNTIKEFHCIQLA
jgi:hypothetical protein